MSYLDEGFRYFEGPSVGQFLPNLKKSTYDYAIQHDCIYVGITGDIDQRTKAHFKRSRGGGNTVPRKSQGWSQRIAIYNTTDSNDARNAEKALIRYLRSSRVLAHKCLNKTMGGELVDQYHHYYVYLLLGPSSVRNIYWG